MDLSLLNFLQVNDSLFPIGTFTLSNGLETFVQEEKLQTCEDLQMYIDNYLSFMPYNELGFFSHVFQYSCHENEIIYYDNLYNAYKSSSQVRKGSLKLCRRFIKVWDKIENLPLLAKYKELIKLGFCYGHHVIVLALFAKEKGISYEDGASVFAYNTLSGIVTNAVKTVPLSQLEGQLVLNKSLQKIKKIVEEAKKTPVDELGICGSQFDIYAMKHETLYSRLYMS